MSANYIDLQFRGSPRVIATAILSGTDGVTLVWLGRRRIPGIEPGRTVRASGRVAVRDGRKVIYLSLIHI